MDWPDFVQPPPAPEPPARVETYPRVLRQVPDGDSDMLVTFALPGLRRHTVRVPLTTWLRGEHLLIGTRAHIALDALLPAANPDQQDAPADVLNDAS